MPFKHLFKATASWTKGMPGDATYSRNHTVTIEGKQALEVSAAKAFKGDARLYNPEDLLLTSVTSCHMMSYLYVCARQGIEVLTYTDNAEAILELQSDGSGRFTEVRLYPVVTIAQADMKEKALALHHQANQLCFIANSCNFPILHFPTCEAAY